MLGRVGDVFNVLLGLAALAGLSFVLVPLSIGIAAVLMALAVLLFAHIPFQTDGLQIDSVPEDKRNAARHHKLVMKRARVTIGLSCSFLFLVLVGVASVWYHAPVMISQGARDVVRQEIASHSSNEALRYVAAPAISVALAPNDGTVGMPVVAPAPSSSALGSRREIAALPLAYVLTRTIGDAGEMFGGLSWIFLLSSCVLGILVWLGDLLLIKQYVS